jgi:hypothetical protein
VKPALGGGSELRPGRPSYLKAIRWIALNDDTSWLDDEVGGEVIPSVTSSLVMDVFNKTEREIIRDLRRILEEGETG